MQLRARKSAAAADVPASERRGVLEYGFWVFLLIAVGRLGELVPGLGSLPLAKVALGFTLIALAAGWKRLPGLKAGARPLARTAFWLVGIGIVLTPLSYWRGASIAFVINQLSVLLAATVSVYMVGRTWQGIRSTLLVLVICGFLLTRAALASYTGGRAAADTMYDTNDLAYVLVTVLPVAVAFVITSPKRLWKIVYAGVAASFVVAILLTSSRGGFLGLVAEVILFVFMPIKPVPLAPAGKVAKKRSNKLILPLIAAALGFILVWPHLPQDTRDRFASILSLGNDYNLDATNEKSRGRIWRRGVIATVQRPWGYGPNSFGMVDLNFGGKMMAPHNSFVEIMVEFGVIGLILFLRMYFLCWRGLGRMRRAMVAQPGDFPQKTEQIIFARMLQITLVGNAIAGFFLSMAYVSVLWMTFGLIMATLAHVAPPVEDTALKLKARFRRIGRAEPAR